MPYGRQADRSASDHPAGKAGPWERAFGDTVSPMQTDVRPRHVQGKPGRQCDGSEPGKWREVGSKRPRGQALEPSSLL